MHSILSERVRFIYLSKHSVTVHCCLNTLWALSEEGKNLAWKVKDKLRALSTQPAASIKLNSTWNIKLFWNINLPVGYLVLRDLCSAYGGPLWLKLTIRVLMIAVCSIGALCYMWLFLHYLNLKRLLQQSCFYWVQMASEVERSKWGKLIFLVFKIQSIGRWLLYTALIL